MRVQVATPTVVDDTVEFAWKQSAPNPYQRQNRFSFRYPMLDLNRYSTALFYEIFLALQLRVFAAYDTPVEVVFPKPVSPNTVAFWQTYHEATNVTVTPLAASGRYSPWKAEVPPKGLPVKRRYGVMFGGGKDSTLATCLLSEIYGADQVVLVQMVHPYSTEPQEATRIEQRQEGLMLRPMRERLGVVTHHASTDFITIQTHEGRKLRPHLELYSVGFLPALLHWGVSVLTTSYPWTAFPIRRPRNSSLWFRYPLSRPEMLATQSAHFASTAGIDITVTNINLFFSPLSALRLLAERYRPILPEIVMCNYADIDARWCYQCQKCAEYALYGLGSGVVDPRFAYGRLFARSPYIRTIITYLDSGVERTVNGNVLMTPTFTNVVNCFAVSQALANAPIDRVAPYLGATGLGNLLMLKAAFGNTPLPATEQIPQSAIPLLGHETAQQVAQLAADHFPIVDHLEGPFDFDGKRYEYDFAVRCQPSTVHLPHVAGHPSATALATN